MDDHNHDVDDNDDDNSHNDDNDNRRTLHTTARSHFHVYTTMC